MNRYVVFAFSNGEFGSSSPGATSLLATPAIFAAESEDVPLSANAGTDRRVPASAPIRIANLFMDFASIRGDTANGCVPGYPEGGRFGKSDKKRAVNAPKNRASARRSDPPANESFAGGPSLRRQWRGTCAWRTALRALW